jgi:hypothetical protein
MLGMCNVRNRRTRDRDRPRIESARTRETSESRLQQHVIRGARQNVRHRWNAPRKSAYANNETRILILGKIRPQRY